MKILIADDHPIYIEGLKNLLAACNYSDVDVARDGFEAVDKTVELKPDLVLMDIRMPGKDGIQATAEIKKAVPSAKIVMLTSLAEDESLIRAVKAGASGYLLKTLDGAELARCLSDIEAGKDPFSSGLEESLLSAFRNEGEGASGSDGPHPLLTGRERQVLALIAQGRSYKEIGTELFISERTVKFHVERLKAALGLNTKEELASFARKQQV
jgi:DNA-binding NarL/FixJ family response regulator